MRRLIPRRRRTQVILLVSGMLAFVALAGLVEDEAPAESPGVISGAGDRSGDSPGAATDPPGTAPGDAAGQPPEGARSFALGLAVTPPVLTGEAFIAVLERIPALAEYGLMQREPPWEELLAGVPHDELIEREYVPLIGRMRELGLGLILLIDPLDPLDRRREPPALEAAGRSIVEPEIARMHEQWVLALAERFQPEYLGLAVEINTPASHDRPDLYTAIRDLTNRLAPRLRQITPASELLVTFQVDDAWGHLGADPSVDQFALVSEFDVDLIGLSSYPVFVYESPADIPDDYYQRFADAAGGRPLGQFEGGWGSSGQRLGQRGTPELQAEWLRRTEALLDGVEARIWAHLQPTDLALDTWDLPPDRTDTLWSFASMGLLDTAFEPKPVYHEWERMHARPWVGE